ncbi:MAG TPA: hypothetical protein PKE69_21725 [Pyrinomonadaceae bacterium]|nr:hypothetical protein [Pyrinomonadaceae bacterium]
MTFINRNRKVIRKIEVDGCAITDGIRCDWLVINDEDYEHFVELKGNDVVYACEQLRVSITQLSTSPTQDAKHSFVIPSRVIPAINTKIQNLKAIFKKRFNCTLIVKNQQCSFEL